MRPVPLAQSLAPRPPSPGCSCVTAMAALGGHEGRHAQEGGVVAHGLVRRAVGETDALDARGETQGARERGGV